MVNEQEKTTVPIPSVGADGEQPILNNTTENVYQIGFSVDKNLIPTLHIRDSKGIVNNVLLNSLLARIAVRETE